LGDRSRAAAPRPEARRRLKPGASAHPRDRRVVSEIWYAALGGDGRGLLAAAEHNSPPPTFRRLALERFTLENDPMNKTRGCTTVLAALLGLLLISGAANAQEKVVRIGHQKVGAFVLLKASGMLEARLKPLGYTVTWQEFPTGPKLLDGLKAGAVDFAHTGDSPPILAQAAGAPFLYIGYAPDGPKSEAILVHKESSIKTVADLKGKKIGLNKGSNVHYMLVRALDKAGLKYTDVELVFLPPPDGRAAFEKGTIDAWVIWEPYRTTAELSSGARTLIDGTGLVSNNDFFFVAKPFAQVHPEAIDVVLGATRDVFAQAAKDLPGTAKTFSAAAGFPESVMLTVLSHRGFDVHPMSQEVIAEQQRIADTFKSIGLIPVDLKVSDAVRKP
jgi:sulfonate transport system substrate-binding protein